jgi:hypothetical protein
MDEGLSMASKKRSLGTAQRAVTVLCAGCDQALKHCDRKTTSKVGLLGFTRARHVAAKQPHRCRLWRSFIEMSTELER